ncbi:uncharacterized protein METZ01_LOCUS319320, partial [marine metagenome]
VDGGKAISGRWVCREGARHSSPRCRRQASPSAAGQNPTETVLDRPASTQFTVAANR